MPIYISKKSLVSSLIAVLTASLIMITPSLVSAQSDGSDFEITSSKNISAIAGESFTYFVVTNTDTSAQLVSDLPSGLSYSNNQISGTPQETGNFTLEFTGSDTDNTESVNLTVLSATSNDDQESSSGDTTTSGSIDVEGSDWEVTDTAEGVEVGAQSDEGVGLNEIPDTGMSADRALTLTFYVLSLLFLTQVAVRKLFTRSTANEGVNTTSPEASTSKSVQDSEQSEQQEVVQAKDVDSGHIGDGIIPSN